MAKKEVAKGKKNVVEDEAETLSNRPKSFSKEVRMVQAFSRFESEFVGPNLQVCPSTRVVQPISLAKMIGDETTWGDVYRMVDEKTEAQPSNQQAEEVIQPAAKESTYKVDEVIHHMVQAAQLLTPILSPTREVAEPSSEALKLQ